MPKSGYRDITYPQKLLKIGIELLSEFDGAKKHHQIRCTSCGYEWSSTPLSKLQAFQKYGHNGCPECYKTRKRDNVENTHNEQLRTLKTRNIELLSKYNGRLNVTTIKLKFKNHNCGHTFEAAPGNVLFRGIDCSVCGKKERTKHINEWSKQNSEKWQETATEWQLYKSKVVSISRKNYRRNKDRINPNNLPTGKAGTPGAYHLDHIVPIRYCFDHNIPEETCAHPDNLQMLEWRSNVGSRDNLKEGVEIPTCMVDYISIPPNK